MTHFLAYNLVPLFLALLNFRSELANGFRCKCCADLESTPEPEGKFTYERIYIYITVLL